MRKNENNAPEENDEDYKKVIDQLISVLGKAGIKIDQVAVMKVDDNNDDTKKKMDEFIKLQGKNPLEAFIKDIFKEMSEFAENTEEDDDDNEKVFCKCPNCLTFDKFEEMLNLHPVKGQFDYTTMSVGGEDFDVKHWTNGQESFMQVAKHVDDSKKSEEELQQALNKALASEDYLTAKSIVEILKEKHANSKTNSKK